MILVSKASRHPRTAREIEAHHPPGSAAAVSWASLIFRSSKPFSDIALRSGLREEDQLFAFQGPQSSLITLSALSGVSRCRNIIRPEQLLCRQQIRVVQYPNRRHSQIATSTSGRNSRPWCASWKRPNFSCTPGDVEQPKANTQSGQSN